MKRLWRPTLVRRMVAALLLGFPLVWAVLISVDCVLIWQQQRQDARDFASSPIGTQMRIALRSVEDPTEARAITAAIERLHNADLQRRQTSSEQVFQLWDRARRKLIFASSSVADQALSGNPTRVTTKILHGQKYVVFEADTPRWTIYWARTPIDALWVIRELSSSIVLNMAIAFPFLLLPAWFAVSRGLRPLRLLSERIAGRGTEDISPVGIDPRHAELQPLVAALDGLLAKLRGKVESEQAFVANAAHELRTPLAVITAQAHVLTKATQERERVDAELRLEAAIARASHLVHQLLVLTRVEMEQRAELTRTDLPQLIRTELANFFPAALARNIEISLEAADTLPVLLEVHPMRSVLQNLIDNAIRYGRDGGKIVVELVPLAGAIRLSVADDGPGIPESDRARIFDRFYRGARRDEVSGTGLGLTIVKQATARMGGELRLETGPDGRGCCFTLEIRPPSDSKGRTVP